MFILKVKDSFSAAHKLVEYKGECSEIHGHNWEIEVSIECHKTGDIGLTIDFKEIKENFHKIISEFDHTYLNGLSYFTDKNPTSENIAKVIYQLSTNAFSDYDAQVKEIAVKESEKYTAIYRPDENN